MAKWVHADVLDNGIAYIKANCNKKEIGLDLILTKIMVHKLLFF